MPARGGYGGRVALYGERKKPRQISLTNTGWEGLDRLSEVHGSSRSDFLEQLGRGNITLKGLQEIYKKFLNTP